MSLTHLILGDGVAGMSAAEVIRSQRPEDRIVVVSDDPAPFYYRAALTNFLQGHVSDTELWALPPDGWQRLRLERVHGCAVGLDFGRKIVRLADDRTLAYDRVLIATGARARRLDVTGSNLAGIQTLRTLADTKRLIEALPTTRFAVVIGGGILGLEAALGLSKRNVHVTLLHRSEYLLEKVLDRRAAEIVQQRMEAAGIQLVLARTGSEVAPAEFRGKDTRVRELVLSDGRTLACDLALLAIGNVPNTEILSGTRVSLERGLVATDPRMAVSGVDDAYAAGDVAIVHDETLPFQNPPGLWQPARKQGLVAGLNMAGRSNLERSHIYRPGALYVATRAWDLDVGYLGDQPKSTNGLEVLTHESKVNGRPVYKRVFLRDGHIVHAVLLGNRREGRALRHLANLRDAAGDASAVADRLLDPTFDLMSWVATQRRQPGVRRYDQTVRIPRGPVPPSIAVALGVSSRNDLALGFKGSPLGPDSLPGVAPTIHLVVRGETIRPIGDTIRIGRADDCFVRPLDPSLGDAVAVIRREGAVWTLSRTGGRAADIRLNGMSLAEPVVLRDRDFVSMGELKAVVRLAALQAPKQEPGCIGEPSAWLVGDQRFPLNRAVTQIGASPDSDVVVNHSDLSSTHAQVLLHGDAYYVVDAGSVAGTFVGDDRVTTPRILVSGDIVRLGSVTHLRFLRASAPSLDGHEEPRRRETVRADHSEATAYLRCVEGRLAGRTFQLQTGSVVGRGEAADVRIDDSLLSRMHVRFDLALSGWTATDLGTPNGTGGPQGRIRADRPTMLSEGTKLRIGQHTFAFCTTEPSDGVVETEPVRASDRPTVRLSTQSTSLVWEAGHRTWPLHGRELRIGRAPDNDLVISAAAVSAYHARLRRTPDGWSIVDNHSRAGTRVGDRLLRGDDATAIGDGDWIELAPGVVLRCHIGAGGAHEPGVNPRVSVLTPEGTELPPLSLDGDSPSVIGSDGSRCRAVIRFAKVSREHAEIGRTPEGYSVRDLGSRFGTTLDGRPVGDSPVPIRDGDIIGLGDVRMVFHVDPQTPAGDVHFEAASPPSAFRIDWTIVGDPLESNLQRLVEEEVDACIGCHECMRACPLPDAAAVTIGVLNAGVAGHSLGERARRFIDDCTQCHACVPVCPVDIHRSKIVLWHKLKSVPERTHRLMVQVGREAVSAPWTLGELSDRFVRHLLLGALDSAQRLRLLSRARVRRLLPGESLTVEGEFVDALWILLDGDVEVGMTMAGGTFRRMTVLTAGQTIGEVPVLSDQPSDFTARAVGSATAIGFPKYPLKEEMRVTSAFRDAVNALYLSRSVEHHLKRAGSPFAGVDDGPLLELMSLLEAERHAAGKQIASASDLASCLFFVRRGFVTEVRSDNGQEIVSNYLKEGDLFGYRQRAVGRRGEVVRYDAATPVEILWIRASALDALSARHPAIEAALHRPEPADDSARFVTGPGLAHGPHLQATELMVIDTSVCVDCDNCVDACERRHGHSRLGRTGMQVSQYLIPASCYHCNDPVCLLCAVDGIVREPTGEIRVVQESCIGCGACAERCPYDNIQMVPRRPTSRAVRRRILPQVVRWFGSRETATPRESQYGLVAVKCDLCAGHKDGPACVRACPVDAAMRVDPRSFFRVPNEGS